MDEFTGKKPIPDFFERLLISKILLIFVAYAHKRGLLLRK